MTIIIFSDLLGFAIGKVGVFRLPWDAKIKCGHLECSGVFPLGLDRHKSVYKVSAGQLPTDFFEFQSDMLPVEALPWAGGGLLHEMAVE